MLKLVGSIVLFIPLCLYHFEHSLLFYKIRWKIYTEYMLLGIRWNFLIQRCYQVRKQDWENTMFRLLQTRTKFHICWWFEIYQKWMVENTIAVWHLKNNPIIYAIRRLVFYTSMVSKPIENSIVHSESLNYYMYYYIIILPATQVLLFDGG